MKQTALLLRKMEKQSFTFLIILLSSFSTLNACTHNSTNSDMASDENREFTITKGVNIGNWLSQSDIRGEKRIQAFTQIDIDKLSSYGFDHIRLPVDEEQLFHKNGDMDMETMQLVHNVIHWCRDKGMKVIFDLHILRSHNFGNATNLLWNDKREQEKLSLMWMAIAEQLEQYPVSLVAYELMNEPVAPNNYQWNLLALKLIKQIREKEKERIIVLGANRWSGVEQIQQLSIPQNDANLILEFHFYEPYLLTHYQAGWTNFATLNKKGTLQYPGLLISDKFYSELNDIEKIIVSPYNKRYDKAFILNQWQSAIDFAKAKGLKLYCGEFGCLPNVGEKSRLAWIQDIVNLCQENDIAYSYWEYNSIFGFADKDGNIINLQLLNSLVK